MFLVITHTRDGGPGPTPLRPLIMDWDLGLNKLFALQLVLSQLSTP
jgi:hypothetical protein